MKKIIFVLVVMLSLGLVSIADAELVAYWKFDEGKVTNNKGIPELRICNFEFLKKT